MHKSPESSTGGVSGPEEGSVSGVQIPGLTTLRELGLEIVDGYRNRAINNTAGLARTYLQKMATWQQDILRALQPTATKPYWVVAEHAPDPDLAGGVDAISARLRGRLVPGNDVTKFQIILPVPGEFDVNSEASITDLPVPNAFFVERSSIASSGVRTVIGRYGFTSEGSVIDYPQTQPILESPDYDYLWGSGTEREVVEAQFVVGILEDMVTSTTPEVQQLRYPSGKIVRVD